MILILVFMTFNERNGGDSEGYYYEFHIFFIHISMAMRFKYMTSYKLPNPLTTRPPLTSGFMSFTLSK